LVVVDDLNDQVVAARIATRQAEAVARAKTELNEVKTMLTSVEFDAKDTQARAEAANFAYIQAEQQATCELDGTCGTGVPGVSEAYR
jgi:hypothetical protein